jgi:hypothetical protein
MDNDDDDDEAGEEPEGGKAMQRRTLLIQECRFLSTPGPYLNPSHGHTTIILKYVQKCISKYTHRRTVHAAHTQNLHFKFLVLHIIMM